MDLVVSINLMSSKRTKTKKIEKRGKDAKGIHVLPFIKGNIYTQKMT